MPWSCAARNRLSRARGRPGRRSWRSGPCSPARSPRPPERRDFVVHDLPFCRGGERGGARWRAGLAGQVSHRFRRSQASASARCPGDLFAPYRESFSDLSTRAGLGVVAYGASEAADRIGDERKDRLAGEVGLSAKVDMIIGGRTFQIGLPRKTVLVAVDRGQRGGDLRSRVGVLLVDVRPRSRRSWLIWLCRLDPEHVAVDQSASGVANTSVSPTSRSRLPP